MIERSTDLRRIKKLTPWKLEITNDFIYLIEVRGGDLGVWGLHPFREGLMAHVEMGTKCRGKRAVASAHNACRWIFENTGNKIVYVGVPKEMKHVYRLAAFGGMAFRWADENKRYYSMTETDFLRLMHDEV